MKRVNLNFEEGLLAQIDAYAERMHLNRTAAITVLVTLALDSQKAMTDLGELLEYVRAEEAKKLSCS